MIFLGEKIKKEVPEKVNSKSKISTVIYVVAIGLFIIIVAFMTFFLTYNPNRQITSTDIDHIKGEEYYDKFY